LFQSLSLSLGRIAADILLTGLLRKAAFWGVSSIRATRRFSPIHAPLMHIRAHAEKWNSDSNPVAPTISFPTINKKERPTYEKPLLSFNNSELFGNPNELLH
jgi:hypothetical protein